MGFSSAPLSEIARCHQLRLSSPALFNAVLPSSPRVNEKAATLRFLYGSWSAAVLVGENKRKMKTLRSKGFYSGLCQMCLTAIKRSLGFWSWGEKGKVEKELSSSLFLCLLKVEKLGNENVKVSHDWCRSCTFKRICSSRRTTGLGNETSLLIWINDVNPFITKAGYIHLFTCDEILLDGGTFVRSEIILIKHLFQSVAIQKRSTAGIAVDLLKIWG